MAGKNKLTDQKAIDAIVDSIFKVAGTSRKQAPATGKNGKDGKDAPQINDGEALSTNPWSGLKTQEEIAKVEGKIYPCTAQALEAMTQEQQAELYTQGYRAIKTENNGTVVLLGLSSDGSLEWLGCNQPRGNLLDNPDFAIAQAGYGGMHGTQMYAADRWKTMLVSDVSVVGDELTFSTSDGYGGLSQYIRVENLPDSESYTFSLRYRNGGDSDAFLNVELAKDSGEWSKVGGEYFQSSHDDFSVAVYNFTRDQISGWDMIVAIVQSVDVGSMVILHPVLLPGSYTPKTLPPFEKTNKFTELLKCQNYFWKVTFGQNKNIAIGFEGNTYSFFFINLPTMMRTNTPTFTQSAPIRLGSNKLTFSFIQMHGTSVELGASFDNIPSPAGVTYAYCEETGGVTLTFSNDL